MESCPHFPRAEGPHSQKPLTFMEAAELHGSRVPSTGPPGSSIGALDNDHIHPPRGPLNLSGQLTTLISPSLGWGAGEALLSPAVGVQVASGRGEDVPGRADPGLHALTHSWPFIEGLPCARYRVKARSFRTVRHCLCPNRAHCLPTRMEIQIAFATEDPHTFWKNHFLLASTMCNTANPRPHLSPTIITGPGMDRQVKQPDKKALLASSPDGACRHHNLFFLFFMMIWGCDPWCYEWNFFQLNFWIGYWGI